MKKTAFLSVVLIFFQFICLKTQANEHSFNFYGTKLSFYGEISSYQRDDISYLGTQIGAGPNIFDFVQTGNDFFVHTGGVNLDLPLRNDFFLITNMQYSNGDISNNFARLDPGGDNLLIPGTGVGPSGAGFFLPGPNNQINNASFDSEYQAVQLYLAAKKQYALSPRLLVSPSLGLEYKRTNNENEFSGDIPFFVRTFDYRTDIDVETISPKIGLNAKYQLTSKVNLISNLHYAYNINNGDGKDQLTFTAFGTQTANMSNNDPTHSYGASLGASYAISDKWSINAIAKYDRVGNNPVLNIRDGVSVSDFEYEDADIYSASIRATYQF